MASFNRVILVGRLTRDPETRQVNGGSMLAKLGLAISDTFTTKSGEDRDKVCFVDIDVWGKQATSCGEFLKKGSQALIEGALDFQQWEDKNGQKKSKLCVKAARVVFLNGGAKKANGSKVIKQSRKHDEQDTVDLMEEDVFDD